MQFVCHYWQIFITQYCFFYIFYFHGQEPKEILVNFLIFVLIFGLLKFHCLAEPNHNFVLLLEKLIYAIIYRTKECAEVSVITIYILFIMLMVSGRKGRVC